MSIRSISIMLMATLLLMSCSFAARAGGPVTTTDPISSPLSEVRAPGKPEWLMPDTAFSCEISPWPLLQIPVSLNSNSSAITANQNSQDQGAENISRQEAQHDAPANTNPLKSVHSLSEQKPRSQQRLDDEHFAGLKQLGETEPLPFERLPRLILTTLIVLAACAATLFVARRWLMQSGMRLAPARGPRLKLIASLTVSARNQLHVVQFDNREVLLAVDARGIQNIQIMTPEFNTLLEQTTELEQTNEADISRERMADVLRSTGLSWKRPLSSSA